MKLSRTRMVFLAVAMGLALAFLGCEGGGGAPKEEEKPPDLGDGRPPELIGNGVVYGTVISAESGIGVGGVAVKLLIGNVHALDTTTSEAAAAAAPAEDQKKAQAVSYSGAAADVGAFQIDSVPSGMHTIILSKTGLETIKKQVGVPVSDEKQVFVPVTDTKGGPIRIGLGFDASFSVTFNSALAQNVLVSLYPVGGGFDVLSALTATTDSAGLAKITGVAQRLKYDIFVNPQDTNSDGYVDFETYWKPNMGVADFAYKQTAAQAMPIVLMPIKPGKEAEAIATNCLGQLVEMTTCDLPKGEPLRIIFNRPVQLVSTGEMVYTADDLLNKDPAAPDIEIKMAPSLSAQDVILTLTPDKELVEGYTYSSNAQKGIDKIYLTYTAGNEVKQLDYPPPPFYVIPSAKLDIAAVMLDNYNFKAGANAADFPAASVQIKFPKMVKGRVLVKAYTHAGTATTLNGVAPNGQPVEIPLAGCQTIADHVRSGATPCQNNQCGCDTSGACGNATLFYSCPLGNQLGDDFDDNGKVGQNNDITLVVEVTDSVGDKINQEVKLPVK